MDQNLAITTILDSFFETYEEEWYKLEDKIFMKCMETTNLPCVGTVIITNRWHDIVRHFGGQGYELFASPKEFASDIERIFDIRSQIDFAKKRIKNFMNRAFLRMETPADLTNLFPDNMHNYFSPRLQREIYDSTPVLNQYNIDQWLRKEEPTLKLIRRQLLENIVLRG